MRMMRKYRQLPNTKHKTKSITHALPYPNPIKLSIKYIVFMRKKNSIQKSICSNNYHPVSTTQCSHRI